jgi:hypothetical protein
MDWVFQYDPSRIKMTIVECSGPQTGITAVGELISGVKVRKSEFGNYAVDVTITSSVNPPLTRADLARLPMIADLPVFRPKGQQSLPGRRLARRARLSPVPLSESVESQLSRRRGGDQRDRERAQSNGARRRGATGEAPGRSRGVPARARARRTAQRPEARAAGAAAIIDPRSLDPRSLTRASPGLFATGP